MKIGILGYGTIGKGVYEIARNHPLLEVVKILERQEKFDSQMLDLFTSSLDEIVNNQEIELIVEVLGGYDFAKKAIVRSLENKKHVVTANKEVMALDIDELLDIAKKNGVQLLYEASVGGGIPIIKNLKELVLVNEIFQITGILNGTTNFILTKMFSGMAIDEAIREAQIQGFAEADPTADLEGFDMMRKIAILSDLAWNTKIDINHISHQGIRTITNEQIKEALSEGKVIKFVCEAIKDKNKIKIRVSPQIFDKSHFFYSINNEFNAIILKTYPNDTLVFTGKGAGSLPTASAIINDIVAIINNTNIETYQNINKYIIE